MKPEDLKESRHVKSLLAPQHVVDRWSKLAGQDRERFSVAVLFL
jgi:hypothetical protein